MRIVNGEIIRDNNDGYNRRRSNNRGNIASLNSNSSEIPPSQSSSSSSNSSKSTGRRMNENDTPSRNNNSTWNDYAQAMNVDNNNQRNFFHKMEVALGIENKVLTIPAYPDINLTESKIPMIYIVITAVGYLLFESKALLIGVAAFIYMKHNENS